MRILVFFCTLFFIASCGSDKKSNAAQTPNEPTAQQEPVKKDVGSPVIPGIDQAVLAKLYNEAEYLDFLFFELPFSMNQSDKPSIQASLANFSPDPQNRIPAGCKPIARMMYQINGEIVDEFNVYFSKECTFFVQMVNEKPFAANKMSENGVKFFQKVLSQAIQTGQQQ